MSKNVQNEAITRTIRHKILNEEITSQALLVCILEEEGFGKIHQSMVSRILTKLGAVRVLNEDKKLFYQIPHQLEMPSAKTNIEEMINDIDFNRFFIIIKTTPSAAELVARLVDSLRSQMGIMGIVSGDDTIFVTPTEEGNTKELTRQLAQFFSFNSKT